MMNVIRTGIVGAVATLISIITPAAEATFAGDNGRLAVSTYVGSETQRDIWSFEADGSDATRLAGAPGEDVEPNWSPDGTKIVFSSQRHDPTPDGACGDPDPCDRDIYVMNADGTGVVRLTSTLGEAENEPAWSPDGGRIAYTSKVVSGGTVTEVIKVMNADGSDPQTVIEDELSSQHRVWDPTWSPDGTFLAFSSWTGGVAVQKADGTGPQQEVVPGLEPDWSQYNNWILSRRGSQQVLAKHPVAGTQRVVLNSYGGDPTWSPDGTKVAYTIIDVYLTTPDGNGSTLIFDTDRPNGTPGTAGMDWQPVPRADPGNTYARPKSATPMRLSLVPVFEECAAPDRTHGPPLAFSSCSNPKLRGTQLTIGTPDANGFPNRSIGSVTITAVPGNPATITDEADVRIALNMTDVRRQSDVSDYTNYLVVPLDVRHTGGGFGHDNFGGPDLGTIPDETLKLEEFLVMYAGCTPTADPAVGSTCAGSTTADALSGGLVVERERTTWQLGAISVLAQGDVEPFARQGVLVP